LDFTGERYLPKVGGSIRYEHLHRYALCLPFAEKKDVLDIACGEGYGSAALAQIANTVTGVDIDEPTVVQARRTYQQYSNLSFLTGSCEAIPLPDSSVDLVVSFETIEHHAHHTEMLNEIKRVLRPAGVLIISSPNRTVYSEARQYQNPFHVKELDYGELYNLLSGYFKQLNFYSQEVVACSLVTRLKKLAVTTLPVYGESFQPIYPQLSQPVYYVVVCSDIEITQTAESIYLEGDNLVEQLKQEWQGKLPVTRQEPIVVLEQVPTITESEDESVSRAALWWDTQLSIEEGGRAHCGFHPAVQAQLTKIRDGLSLSEWVVKRFNKNSPVNRAISLGSGTGDFEFELLAANLAQHVDMYEVSQARIEKNRERLREAKLEQKATFFASDMNKLQLNPNSYDVAIFMASLHHVFELEQVLKEVYKGLVPGGMLFAYEYIGPDRFAFPATHTFPARAFYRTLEPGFRSGHADLPLPDPQEVAYEDPTEAVHSAAIVEALYKIFDRVEVISIPQTISMIIWPGLNMEAIFESAEGYALMEEILAFDEAMVNAGVVPAYHAYLAAWKEA